jgi:hypothetical protein
VKEEKLGGSQCIYLAAAAAALLGPKFDGTFDSSPYGRSGNIFVPLAVIKHTNTDFRWDRVVFDTETSEKERERERERGGEGCSING